MLNWWDHIEIICEYLHLNATEKLECVVFMLRGAVKHWWKIVKLRYYKDTPLTWTDFEREFHGKYVWATHLEDIL